jgi:C-terminal processing protease CtpA/Prc
MDINTIPFFCSYLFDQPVQIGDILLRETNETRQIWTYAQVPGKKYLDKPVFVLTSGKTASGAEAFVSSMKRLKRATLIGETTKGATMPGGSHRVNEHFSLWISTGRSSSGSAQNENKGAQPDVSVSAADALNEAYRQALDRVIQASQDQDWKAELTKIRLGLSAN